MPELTTTIILAISTTIACASFGLSFAAYRRSRYTNQADVFIKLRTRFLSIHNKLPESYRNEHYEVKNDPEELQAMENYWISVFDEWYVTTKVLRNGQNNLWNEFYSHAIEVSLKHRSMIEAFESVKGKVSFGKFRNDFVDEIEKLKRNASMA